MRSRYYFAAGLLIGSALAPAISADRKVTIQAPASAGATAGINRPQDRLPTRGTQPTQLTPGECKQLGGDVIIAAEGLCATGLYCMKQDNKGKVNNVCIDKML
jgi:hypothetical protein